MAILAAIANWWNSRHHWRKGPTQVLWTNGQNRASFTKGWDPNKHGADVKWWRI